MANGVLIEELHLSVSAPRGLAPAEYDALRRALDGLRLRARLGRFVRGLLHREPSLRPARVRVSR
jgi:hypothetical protein